MIGAPMAAAKPLALARVSISTARRASDIAFCIDIRPVVTPIAHGHTVGAVLAFFFLEGQMDKGHRQAQGAGKVAYTHAVESARSGSALLLPSGSGDVFLAVPIR